MKRMYFDRWVRKQDWDSVLAANLNGVYLITQAVLPGMIEHGGGSIVTVSSVAAYAQAPAAPIVPLTRAIRAKRLAVDAARESVRNTL